MDPSVDVLGVGNAIVDVIATVPEAFIAAHGLVKGAMTLIDAQRARDLHAVMPAGTEASGGSAANTAAGVASFGGRAAYIGKVRADHLGEFFVRDIAATGVAFDVAPAVEGPPTARCLIQVTPDAERTMNTFLGITALLAPDDIDTDLVASANITYCEGYLWDVDVAKDAIRTAMAAAADAGRTVALALSDTLCVNRHRSEWLDLIDDHVDLVFANEAEICALHRTEDRRVASGLTAEMARVVVVTKGELGSEVVTRQEIEAVPATQIDSVVDATGAGDLYASGFLWCMCGGASLRRCAQLGSIAAAEVISHVGARPHTSLAKLVG